MANSCVLREYTPDTHPTVVWREVSFLCDPTHNSTHSVTVLLQLINSSKDHELLEGRNGLLGVILGRMFVIEFAGL